MEASLDVIPNLVSKDLNRELTAIPFALEVKDVVFYFEGSKA